VHVHCFGLVRYVLLEATRIGSPELQIVS